MTSLHTIEISDARLYLRGSGPDVREEERSRPLPHSRSPFILNDPETDSLSLIASLKNGRHMVCNQWKTAHMPAHAFFYFYVNLAVIPEVGPDTTRKPDAVVAAYSADDGTIAVGSRRFKFYGLGDLISKADFQGKIQSENPVPPSTPGTRSTRQGW